MTAGLRLNKYMPHLPTPKQAAFLLLRHQEAFYGGAAGGGKSDALLMAALQYVDVPGYSAILFRRTFTDLMLPDAIMDRAATWLSGTDARFSAATRQWRFPSGATLTFGYLAHENDKYRYQSAQFQFIGFDELTQFRESQYLYLFSRLRRLEDSNVPVRMRSASNPGGVGHDWVKQRFIVEGRAAGRIYIPASLVDNPFLDQETYRQSLEQLDHVTRSQLLNGNWDEAQGNLFRRDNTTDSFNGDGSEFEQCEFSGGARALFEEADDIEDALADQLGIELDDICEGEDPAITSYDILEDYIGQRALAAGLDPTAVKKSGRLGGRVADLYRTYPDLEPVSAWLGPLRNRGRQQRALRQRRVERRSHQQHQPAQAGQPGLHAAGRSAATAVRP